MTDEQKQQTRDRIGLRIMALRKLAGLMQEQHLPEDYETSIFGYFIWSIK